MEDVEVRADLRATKVYCAVAKDIAAEVQALARRRGITPETLVNLWLREKVVEASRGS